jgi:hypothetical protein
LAWIRDERGDECPVGGLAGLGEAHDAEVERAGRLVVGPISVVGAERALFVSAGDGEPPDGGAVEPVPLVVWDSEFVAQDLLPPDHPDYPKD